MSTPYEQPFIANPLAFPLMQLLTAVWDDPKYHELAVDCLATHARHAMELIEAHKSGEKMAPVLAMCAIYGFTEKEYAELIIRLAKKAGPLP